MQVDRQARTDEGDSIKNDVKPASQILKAIGNSSEKCSEEKPRLMGSTMRYDERALESSMTSKPVGSRAVKIPCPWTNCDQNFHRHWICSRCEVSVEFSLVDDYLYCECGACKYDKWEFHCQDDKHGSRWSIYPDSADLLALLRDLEPFKQVNILILGETGVGKSTWINAFINYLTYDSLTEALESKDMKWVIPCSFSTQITDENGKWVRKDIKIGASKTELDGSKGNSATQETTVHVFDIGEKLRVRLIDTPGIGDTRGLETENRNMEDILQVLRNYDDLHGILILLKPNAARLTVMFKFCIKQLLTHLHRQAANNMVFGFTNTRGSNYTPGDTFDPLLTLLHSVEEVKFELRADNVYCFDSESFRYLAAQKNGVEMGYRDENNRSWEMSVDESKRMLTYFSEMTTPHKVRSTTNLNEVRHVVLNLAEPMARIMQQIQISIAVNGDSIKELTDTKQTREDLEKSLFVQVESLESCEVDKPRTVCTNSKCVEVRSDLEGRRGESVVIYKTLCHIPCHLKNVPRQTKGDPNIQGCSCVGGGGMCINTKCNHHWMDHMHIYVEYKKTTYRHEDEGVKKQLIENLSDIALKEKAIQMKKDAIEEFEVEYAQIKKAAVRFGCFLKRNAITVYNDATLDYIDHLIHEEEIKLSNSASTSSEEKIQKLKEQRAVHVEELQALTAAIDKRETGEITQKDVGHIVTNLFALPNYGKDIEKMVRTNKKAENATYREHSHSVAIKPHHTSAIMNFWEKSTRMLQVITG